MNGRQIFRNTHTSDKPEAERQLAIIVGEKAKGTPIAPHPLTLAEAIKNVKAAKAADGKEANYAYNKHLAPHFGLRTKLAAITTPRIREYVAKRLGAGAARATVNRELEALGFAFSLAMRDRAIHAKPHIPALDETNVRTGFFERDEFERMVERLGSRDRKGRVRFENLQDAARFGYVTGWRLGEVLGLTWRNVDFKAGEVRLDPGTTKNGEGRVFPMTQQLRALLLRRRDAQPTVTGKRPKVVAIEKGEHVFTTKKGERIGNFRKRWRKACAAAGCPGRLYHDLRRTAVRNLVRSGVSRSVAMRLTGHKTESVFERYNITSPDDLRDAARRLDGLA